MKVCIIGGTGNIGVFLGEELLRFGHQVTSFSRRREMVPVRIRDTRVRVWFGNISDKAAVVEFLQAEKPDAVVLATAPERHCPEKYIPGHKNVFAACKECGISRIIVCSNHMGLNAPDGRPMMVAKPPHFEWFVDIQKVYGEEARYLKENENEKELDWLLVCPGLQCVPFGGYTGKYRVQEDTILVEDPEHPDWNTSRISYEDYISFLYNELLEHKYSHKYLTVSY